MGRTTHTSVPFITRTPVPIAVAPRTHSRVTMDEAATTQTTTPPANPTPEDPDTNVVVESAVFARYSLSGAAADTATETLAALPFVISLAPDLNGRTIVPGSVVFTWGGDEYIDRLGILYKNPDMTTGQGVDAGTIDYGTGIITLTSYGAGNNTVSVKSLLMRQGRQFLANATFRTPGSPLRPGSFSILGVASDGTQLSATANFDGTINGNGIEGYIDVETGIVSLIFGEIMTAAGNENESWYDAGFLFGDGTIWRPYFAVAETLYYTCVVYSYIPLDADLIGLDPVRLPTDGRVPIVKVGDIVVVHNTQTQQLTSGLTAGQQITLNRSNIDMVRLYDAEGVYVPTVNYAFDTDTQKLTMADPLDLSAFTEPLIANHRIEDMALVSDVQINGQLTVAAGLTHDYPVLDTWVSSALLFGDLQARLYNMFDQKTWTGIWDDNLIGDACVANFNDVAFPPVVTNSGSIKERWALVVDATDHVQIIGEKVGVVGEGHMTNTLQPINPASGTSYWQLPFGGWGGGWPVGSVLRFNTEAAIGDLWACRTTLSGPVTEPDDEFTIQIRGDGE